MGLSGRQRLEKNNSYRSLDLVNEYRSLNK